MAGWWVVQLASSFCARSATESGGVAYGGPRRWSQPQALQVAVALPRCGFRRQGTTMARPMILPSCMSA